LVLGDDARQLRRLVGDGSNPTIEATAVTPGFKDEIIFQSINEGYVALDDWKDVDAASMMTSIRENTEEGNLERRKQGMSDIHVVGWLQEPTLDRQTSTVFWAIEGSTDDGRIVNSIALRLGRSGYERLNWIADKVNYVPLGGQLDVMLRAHSFDPGSRYADHESGDKIAAYTIGGLVAAVAGAKVLKVVAGVGLLVLLKKFGVVLIAILGSALFGLRGLFRRKAKPNPPTSGDQV